MSTYSTDRRSLLRIIGSIGATCAFPFASEDLYGQTAEHQHGSSAPASPLPHFFHERDFKTIARIADLIIPATDTPGASGAGVPEYIDALVARNTDHQLVVADGLRWLDAEAQRTGQKPFLELSEDQQLAIFEPLCTAYDANRENPARNVQFFGLIKNLTADGYYTSRVGLMDELRYQGNKILSSYPECH
ncbi:MAG TPA: gluconate 2-dehydrogenase subunit 3 family protein [Bryobacteraceae bacterium]